MTKRSVWRPNKDEVVAENGAVASERPLISETGVEILRQGGNAVDAAVAMGFCAAVVEPQSTCIAGHGQMLVHMDGRTTALDFSHRAPKLATADMYRILGQSEAGNSIYMVENNANVIGYQSIGVPESLRAVQGPGYVRLAAVGAAIGARNPLRRAGLPARLEQRPAHLRCHDRLPEVRRGRQRLSAQRSPTASRD